MANWTESAEKTTKEQAITALNSDIVIETMTFFRIGIIWMPDLKKSQNIFSLAAKLSLVNKLYTENYNCSQVRVVAPAKEFLVKLDSIDTVQFSAAEKLLLQDISLVFEAIGYSSDGQLLNILAVISGGQIESFLHDERNGSVNLQDYFISTLQSGDEDEIEQEKQNIFFSDNLLTIFPNK